MFWGSHGQRADAYGNRGRSPRLTDPTRARPQAGGVAGTCAESGANHHGAPADALSGCVPHLPAAAAMTGSNVSRNMCLNLHGDNMGGRGEDEACG